MGSVIEIVRFRHLQMVGIETLYFPTAFLRSGLSARGALSFVEVSVSHERVWPRLFQGGKNGVFRTLKALVVSRGKKRGLQDAESLGCFKGKKTGSSGR